MITLLKIARVVAEGEPSDIREISVFALEFQMSYRDYEGPNISFKFSLYHTRELVYSKVSKEAEWLTDLGWNYTPIEFEIRLQELLLCSQPIVLQASGIMKDVRSVEYLDRRLECRRMYGKEQASPIDLVMLPHEFLMVAAGMPTFTV